MDFVDAIKICIRKYIDGGGRASRSEFWYFVLYTLITQACLDTIYHPLAAAFGMAVSLPSISAAIRRLHDIDRVGYWLLIGMVPIIGWVALIIWLCLRGTEGPNRFGPPPLAPEASPATS